MSKVSEKIVAEIISASTNGNWTFKFDDWCKVSSVICKILKEQNILPDADLLKLQQITDGGMVYVNQQKCGIVLGVHFAIFKDMMTVVIFYRCGNSVDVVFLSDCNVLKI